MLQSRQGAATPSSTTGSTSVRVSDRGQQNSPQEEYHQGLVRAIQGAIHASASQEQQSTRSSKPEVRKAPNGVSLPSRRSGASDSGGYPVKSPSSSVAAPSVADGSGENALSAPASCLVSPASKNGAASRQTSRQTSRQSSLAVQPSNLLSSPGGQSRKRLDISAPITPQRLGDVSPRESNRSVTYTPRPQLPTFSEFAEVPQSALSPGASVRSSLSAVAKEEFRTMPQFRSPSPAVSRSERHRLTSGAQNSNTLGSTSSTQDEGADTTTGAFMSRSEFDSYAAVRIDMQLHAFRDQLLEQMFEAINEALQPSALAEAFRTQELDLRMRELVRQTTGQLLKSEVENFCLQLESVRQAISAESHERCLSEAQIHSRLGREAADEHAHAEGVRSDLLAAVAAERAERRDQVEELRGMLDAVWHQGRSTETPEQRKGRFFRIVKDGAEMEDDLKECVGDQGDVLTLYDLVQQSLGESIRLETKCNVLTSTAKDLSHQLDAKFEELERSFSRHVAAVSKQAEAFEVRFSVMESKMGK